MHHWHDGWWGYSGMMGIGLLLAAALVAGLVTLLVRSASVSERGPRRSKEDPETILKRRYARGEIDDDELRRRMDTLRGA